MMMQSIPPGTESWAERYGVIGVVAALALAALALGLRALMAERKEDRTRIEREQVSHDEHVAALNEKIVEVVREGQRETLKLLTDQQTAHENRYQALLDRTMRENSENAQALRAQNQATTEALKGVVKRLKPDG
jgi:hypothetical protein